MNEKIIINNNEYQLNTTIESHLPNVRLIWSNSSNIDYPTIDNLSDKKEVPLGFEEIQQFALIKQWPFHSVQAIRYFIAPFSLEIMDFAKHLKTVLQKDAYNEEIALLLSALLYNKVITNYKLAELIPLIKTDEDLSQITKFIILLQFFSASSSAFFVSNDIFDILFESFLKLDWSYIFNHRDDPLFIQIKKLTPNLNLFEDDTNSFYNMITTINVKFIGYEPYKTKLKQVLREAASEFPDFVEKLFDNK